MLAEVSGMLATSLDYEATVQRLASLVVPAVAVSTAIGAVNIWCRR